MNIAKVFTAQTLRQQFLVPLAIAAAVALLGHAILLFHTAYMDQDARIINLAGRQRMLATRLSREAEVLAATTGPAQRIAQASLRTTIATLEREHFTLVHTRSPFAGIPEVRQLLTEKGLHRDTEDLVSAARQLAAAPLHPSSAAHLETIRRLVPSVVQRTDDAVNAYEAVFRRSVATLVAVEAAALALMLATLAFIALRVFRPMALRIETNHARLAHHRDELAAANIAVTRYRNRLQAIFESAGEGICGLDAQYRITFANPAAARLLDTSADELPGLLFFDLCADERHAGGPTRLRRRDGTLLDVLLTITPLREEGVETGAVALFVDVTEHHRLQQTLDAERSFVSTVLDTVASLVVVFDRAGNIVRFNRRCEEITGYRLEEVRGKPVWEITPPGEQARVRAAFEKIEAGRFPDRCENHWLTRSGELRLITWSNSFLRGADGLPEFIVATGLDLTEDLRLRRALGESEIRYDNVISHASEAIIVLDENGRPIETNRIAEELSGYDSEELRRLRFQDLIREDARERFAAFIDDVLAKDSGHINNVPLVTRGGELRFTDMTASLVPMGEARVVQAIVRDITERKRQEESIALAARVFESSGDGILITDANSTILQVNRAFEIITGYTREEAIGKTPRILQSGRQSREFYAGMWHQLTTTGRWQGELWNRRKNGEVYAEWVTIDRVLDESRRARNYVAIFRDVTANKVLEENLRHLANFDPLTGLPNRALFQDRLQQALAQAARNDAKIILMLLDLDRFKQINDTFGHQIGDQLLVEAAERLRRCVRESDTVARLGGDEFTILLHNMHDLSHVVPVAEKIIAAMSEPFLLKGEPREISTSIGIAVYPDGAHDGTTLLRQADIAMYAAKRAGGACFRFHTPEMELKTGS